MAVLYLTWKDRWCQQKARGWKKREQNKKGDPNFLFKIDIKEIFKDFMAIMAELKLLSEPEPWPKEIFEVKQAQHDARQIQVL